MGLYDLDYSVKSFAVANDFVVNTNKACYQLGKNLQPFGIFINDTQKQYGVLDFASFQGFLDPSMTLVEEIANYRKDVFRNSGINVDISDETKRRLLFFDYLTTISICYVEVPKYVTKDGMPMATFDKFLCTRNPAIMGAWMGCDPAEMQAKYSAKIRSQQVDFNDNLLRVVKLNHTSKGNSVSVPRTAYDVTKMTCIPMYMLYAFVEGFKPLLSSNIINFSFLKDNGTIRELPTTLSEDILRDYYTDNLFISTMLQGVDINTVQQGGMTLSSKMNRGYIKVPEVGASIYDGTGCRSLNLARILKATIVPEVDRSFINVDLNSVIENFCEAVEYILKKQPESLSACYSALTGELPDTEQHTALVTKLEDYARTRDVLLSTTFRRSLHMFMVNNPSWFPLYTGKPNAKITSSANYGVGTIDF